MNEMDPYLAFLGVDLDFDNNALLNVKKKKMSFEIDTLHLISPMDLTKGE